MNISNALSHFFAIGALLASSAIAGDFRFELTPKQIRPGEHARLLVRVPYVATPGTPLPDPVINDELLTQNQQLVILEREMKEEKGEILLRLDFTVHKAGTFQLPPIEIRIGANSYSTEALSLEVVTDRPPGDVELRPELGELSYPKPWGRWIATFLLALIALYLLRRSFERWRARPKRSARFTPPPEEDPLLWLRRNLDRFADAIDSNDQLPSTKSDELIKIIQTYFAMASKSPVKAWTVSEFQERFAKDPVAQEMARRFQKWIPLHYLPNPTPEPLSEVASEVEKVLLP